MTKSPNPVDVAVGRNIRMHRIAIKLSQEALGDRIGVTFQQVQKYEKGTNRVGASRLNMIATVLGIPVSRFFDDVTPSGRKNQPALTELLAEPRALRLARAFAEISDGDLRQTIVQLVERLATDRKSAR